MSTVRSWTERVDINLIFKGNYWSDEIPSCLSKTNLTTKILPLWKSSWLGVGDGFRLVRVRGMRMCPQVKPASSGVTILITVGQNLDTALRRIQHECSRNRAMAWWWSHSHHHITGCGDSWAQMGPKDNRQIDRWAPTWHWISKGRRPCIRPLCSDCDTC